MKTFYSSTVGVIGSGKLARTNGTTISTPTKVKLNEAKTTTTDLKTAESNAHNGTFYPSILAAINLCKVV